MGTNDAAPIDASVAEEGAAPIDAAIDSSCTPAGETLGLQQQFPSDTTKFDGIVTRIHAFGVRWVRMYWMWPWVEPNQGKRDFTAIKTAVDSAHAHGMKIVVLATGAPPWANGNQAQDYPPTSAHYADYAAYAAAIATSTNPDAIEIWNEPNNKGFWSSGPDPVAMAHMQVAAYAAIKAASPATVVITGGLTQVTFQPQQFFSQMLAADPKLNDSFDGVGLHPYNEPADPLQPGAFPNILTVQMPAIQQQLAQVGRGDAPFWMTEYGVATSGQYSVTEAQQATYYTSFFTGLANARAAGITIGPSILYMLQDSSAYGASTSEQPYFGVYKSDGTAKPAEQTLMTFAATCN
jgi:hypothetical protein